METHIGKADRMTRVDQVLHDVSIYKWLIYLIINNYNRDDVEQLNLEKCRDTLIGVFGTKGISGGEKRRLAFASEVFTHTKSINTKFL